MPNSLKVAVVGLGTVGAETIRVLQRNAPVIAARCGRPIEVVAVSARTPGRERGFSMEGITWYDDPVALVSDHHVDVVCELVGGEDGVAGQVVRAALGRGYHVVTANKALLAHHGAELAALAEKKGVALGWEAAVAGGIPVVKVLREGLSANQISCVYGILNGTCNYILTNMRETGRNFADVLLDAQKLGYAEADPSFDVDGVDTAHKLEILTSLAFGTRTDFDAIYVEGIRSLTAMDIAFADELGYRIKLLGIAQATDRGIEQRVHPCLVRKDAPIAAVEGVFNAVVAEGQFVGRSVLEGRGAGGGPTASAVVADLMDIAAGRVGPVFGVPVADLVPLPEWTMEARKGAYYVRLMVEDLPGVFAEIAAALRDAKVSMEAVVQRGRAPGVAVPVVMILHETVEAALNEALRRIRIIAAVVEPPQVIRIESF